MIRLEFCGRLRPLAPAGPDRFAKPQMVHTLGDLCDWLAADNPLLGEALEASIRFVVNDAFVHERGSPVRDGDEVAFLPPMSGG